MSLRDSQDGMTTAAEESQDTPDASLADTDTQEDQDKEATAAGKKKKGGTQKKAKAKLPIFTGLPPELLRALRKLCE